MRAATRSGAVREANLEKIVAREVAFIVAGAFDERLAALVITGAAAKRRGHRFLVLFGPPAPTPDDVSPPLDEQDALRLLDRAGPWIRSELADALDLKHVPELSFVPDPVAWSAAVPLQNVG